ncbi:MAG: ATP-binding domain-containing protein [Verrucomicrobia bacterium]|nr:ATP-binding domain-containing protein [Verrucomicrobiota bacterium]
MPASSGGEVVDFESTVPKISTYHSAKGLTFDSVLLPKLVRTNWKNFSPHLRKNMLLVGITRATQWVYSVR